MLFKKIMLIAVTAVTLNYTSHSYSMQLSNPTPSFSAQCGRYLILAAHYFRFGYVAAVDPFYWSEIPGYILGEGLKNLPKENRIAAYTLGAVGFTLGCSLFYFAYKGIKNNYYPTSPSKPDSQPKSNAKFKLPSFLSRK